MVCWNHPTLSTLAPRGNHKGGSYLVASSRSVHSELSSTSTVGIKAWGCEHMSKEQDNRRREESTVLPRLETCAFFLAMMLAITLDGALAYWVWKHVGSVSVPTLDPLREQMGFALPEGWSLAAWIVLICRVVDTLLPAKRWSHNELLQNQLVFLRLWGWAMALLVAQGVAFYLEQAAP